MAVEHQKQTPPGQQSIVGLPYEAPAGVLIHHMAQVERRVQHDQLCAYRAALQSIAVVKPGDRLLRLDGGRLHPLDERETRAYFDGLGTEVGSDPML